MKFLYPYKNALWALRLCNRGRLLSVRPAPTMFDHLYASLHKAFGRSISASLPKPQTPFLGERLCMLGWLCIVQSPCAYTPGIRAGAILLGLPPLDQARMLAVSHTKPLHDAVAQMADDLYGGYAPATPFLSTIEVFRQTDIPAQTARGCFSFYIEKNRLIIISRLLKKLSSPTSPVVTISL